MSEDENKRRKKFTQTFVDKVSSPPKPDRIDYLDTVLPGFNLRVSFTGKKTFSVVARLDGKQRRFAVGDLALYPKVDEARDRAREILRAVAKGIDPTVKPPEPPKATVRTVKEVVAEYVDEYLKPKGLRTWARTEAVLNKHVVPRLGGHDVRLVTRADVRGLIRDLSKGGLKGGVNHVFGDLRRVFKWAEDQEYIDANANPTDKVKTGVPAGERDRHLNDAEVRWLLRALKGADLVDYQAAFVKVMLYTGQRRTEVAGATWDEFDLVKERVWTIPKARTKNNREHLVPLAPPVVAILAGLPKLDSNPHHVFPGWHMKKRAVHLSNYSDIKKKIDDKLAEVVAADGATQMMPWRFHDLRRTVVTGLTAKGVSSDIAGRVVNHTMTDVTNKHYNQYAYLKERRAALGKWAAHVEALKNADAEPVRRGGVGRAAKPGP